MLIHLVTITNYVCDCLKITNEIIILLKCLLHMGLNITFLSSLQKICPQNLFLHVSEKVGVATFHRCFNFPFYFFNCIISP